MMLPNLGEVFDGRYQLESVLGEGGFARVYLATELALGRKVALKVITAEQGTYSNAMRARFHREVGILAGLRGPHIVTLFDWRESRDGHLYMSFELVGGRDLARLLEAEGRLPAASVVHIVRQVLLALDEAHRAGLVHRDIKPDNIRVFEHRGDPLTVKLLDFGIARATDTGHPSLTATGELIGTPRYMSPEQLLDKPLTPGSDIYSLGLVAFELLAGRGALAGGTLSSQLERLRGDHVLFDATIEREAPGLLKVVQHMAARNPADRFSSARAVLHALDHAPGSAPQPVEPSTNKRRAWHVASLALFSLVVVAIVVALTPAFEPDPPPPPPTRALLAADLLKPKNVAEPSAEGVPDVGTAADVTEVDSPAHPTPHPGAIPSAGCGEDKWLEPVVAFDVWARAPRAYDRDWPHPLVVVLHSDYVPPKNFLPDSDFPELIDSERFIVLGPRSGLPPLWNRAWRDIDGEAQRIRRIVTSVEANACIDRSRIFIIGSGEGGHLTRRLACEPWVTAVAFDSYTYSSAQQYCKRAVATKWFHKMDSKYAPPDGTPTCWSEITKLSVATIDGIAAKMNGCKGRSKTTFEDPLGKCKTWSCAAPLESCRIVGGTGWPGTRLPDLCKEPEPPIADFPIEQQAWEFFIAAPPLSEVR